MRGVAVGILFLLGCVESGSAPCGDGVVCPSGTSCVSAETMTGEMSLCVRGDQLDACSGLSELAACTLGAAAGTCHGGACIVNDCGNRLVDTIEQCDDGNQTPGDGCSSDCLSTEQCGNGHVDPVKRVNGQEQPDEQCDDSNTRAHDGCSANCRLESPQWSTLGFGPPAARTRAAASYDPIRDRIYAFGGVDGFGAIGATVAWTGTRWVDAGAPAEPIARQGAAMAYDRARGETILFGGANGVQQSIYADTWRWDGQTWNQLPLTGTVPEGRLGHGLVADHRRGVLVMFGGAVATPASAPSAIGDTWEWNGTAWTQVSPSTSPPARHSHAMAYDEKSGEVVVFGGTGSSGGLALGDTWTYDGTTWTQRTPATSPAARAGAMLAWDPVRQALILYGGAPATGADATFTDTWQWSNGAWTQLASTGPTPRSYSALVTTRTNLVLAGGTPNVSTPLGDTWIWDGTAWTSAATQQVPATLSLCAAAVDPDHDSILTFGGASPSTGVSFELGVLRGGVWTTYAPTLHPARRFSASASYHASSDDFVVFGGFDAGLVQDGTWAWNGTAWRLAASSGQSPPPRRNAGFVYDAARGRSVLFGGNASLDDTWEWDGTSWTQLSPAHKPSGRDATLAYDPIRQRVVLFGGATSSSTLDDTWEWDGADWHEVTPMLRPIARTRATLVWNAARQRLTLLGGVDTVGSLQVLQDMWEWDGAVWTPVAIPQGPGYPQAVGVGVHEGIRMIGGLQGTTLKFEQWTLQWDSNNPSETCSGVYDTDGDAKLGCDDEECWWRCEPRCPPATSCPAQGPGCGDGTCSSLESCRLCPADCGACTSACGDGICDPGETCPGDC